jgi:hypothetical protein
VAGARACRAYLREAVTWLTLEGIDQFVDVGSGLPTAGNVHQLAQHVNSGARVVYIDHDPVVLTYARALLAGDPGVWVLDGDLRAPRQIIDAVQALEVIDWGRPVGLLLSAVLHFIGGDQPGDILATFRAVLPPKSPVVISHVVADDDATGHRTRTASTRYSTTAEPFFPRTTPEITALFDGLDMMPPGVHRLTCNGRRTTVLAGIGTVPDPPGTPGGGRESG